MRICLMASADNHHLVRWARFLAAQGHELLCVCDPPGFAGFQLLPPCPVQHPRPNLLEALLILRLWRHPLRWHLFRSRSFNAAVRQFRPDVLHAMDALAYGYALARIKTPSARVLTPWGSDILIYPDQSPLARWMVRRALHGADAITTNMPNLAEIVVARFGADPNRVRPFSWGVELDIFRPGHEKEASQLRHEWNLPENALVILSNRQVRPGWGVESIVEAFPAVAAREPRAHIVFLRGYGDPAFEAALRQRLEGFGCADRVRWVSEVLSPPRMAAALNLAHAFVSVPPSDLLSISLLEGMACGCLPVAADLLAYRSRLRDGENALLVPLPVDPARLADTLLRALCEPSLRERFAARNLAMIRERDDWAVNARLLEETYAWAIQNRQTCHAGGSAS